MIGLRWSMIEERPACLALVQVHALLNGVRPQPALTVELRGARVQMRPGIDVGYPSTSANRLMVYDPGAADLMGAVERARGEFAAAGVTHWFAKFGPGVGVAEVMAVLGKFGGRVWPDVRYPVLGRMAAPVGRAATTLEVRRADAAEISQREGELATFCDESGARTLCKAAEREDVVVVLGLADGQAVSTGILAVCGATGYLCFGMTHPQFRGRGGQSAIIAERVSIAQERGCAMCLSETVSFLSTSLGNLRRAGFESVFEWTVLEFGREE